MYLSRHVELHISKVKILLCVNYTSIDLTFKKWVLSLTKSINSKFLGIKMEWKRGTKEGLCL